MRKFFFTISTLALLLIFLTLPATSLASPLKLNISLEKPYYTTTETINIKAAVVNSSLNIKKRNRIALTVYDRLFLEEDINNFKVKKKETLWRRYWYKQLKPGKTEFSFKKDLTTTRLAEGVYPIRLKVELSNNQIITKYSFLVLINKKERPLPIALVWDWAEPPMTKVDSNEYKRDWIKKFGTLQKPGVYYRYLDIISQFPNLKLNIAPTPLMLEELKLPAENEEMLKLGKPKQVAENRQNPAANSFSDKLKKLVLEKSGIELIPAPYSSPPLPFLAFQGWGKDINKQLIKGNSAIKTNLAEHLDYQGIFAPDMDLDIKSAERLSAAGVKYSIVEQDNIAGRSSIFTPRLLHLKKDRSLTAFIADNDFNEFLKAAAEEDLRLKLTAFFAKRFFDSEKKSGAVVAVFASGNNDLLQPEKLEKLLRFIEETPWLQSSNLRELYQNITPVKGKLKKWQPDKKFDNEYIDNLILTRLEMANFNISVYRNNPVRRALENKLLISENKYWLKQTSHNRGSSKKYLRDINGTISLVFDNIKISPRQNITFSSKKGKIPIAITNNNNFPLRVMMKFEGDKEFIFNDDKIKRVTIMPKNNLIVHRVEARYTGKSSLNIALYSGKRLIAIEKLTVTVSDATKYILRIISALSLIVIAALIFRKKQRA